MTYDYIIVGSGIFGSCFAYEMHKNGFKCLILEKRSHIGGNIYTSKIDDVHVHEYGAHIFHCNDIKLWNYVNKFAKIEPFFHRVKVNFSGNLYSFPINLMTLHQLWKTRTPEEAIAKLESVKLKIDNPSNMEDWLLSNFGEEIYRTFFYGYTLKQWGREPKKLPASIAKRIPFRTNFNDTYYDSKFQGLPANGYTEIIENMTKDIDVLTGVDYLKDRKYYDSKCKKIIYTATLDAFFDYQFGELEYRSLRFEKELHNIKDYQGCAVMNYTSKDVPFTRICEHKHLCKSTTNRTIITKEFPQSWDRSKEPYYPINDEKNNERLLEYKKLAESINEKYIFGGRLAAYKYYDMHQVIASSLECSKKELLSHG
jgi:UDP-galactopyranose mutase